MIIDISIAVIAFAFLILVIFISTALLSTSKTLKQIEKQLKSFDPLCRSVSNVGEALETASEGLKVKTAQFCEDRGGLEKSIKQEPHFSKLAEGLAVAALAISLCQKFKKRS